MTIYDSIEYKKNILSQVIIRVDFAQFIETELVFDSAIEKVIHQYFPNKGMIQIIRYNTITERYEEGNSSLARSLDVNEGKQREYLSKDLKNKLILSNKYIIFEINIYRNFNKVCEYLNPVFDILFSKTELNTSRVGIRYINLLDSEKMKIQKNFFSQEIAAIINSKTFNDDSTITLRRSMQTVEYLVDDMILFFRFGLYNPQYPGSIVDNSFALDYDCFTGDALNTKEEVMTVLNKGHDSIQKLFEESITDSLRKVMNDE